MPFDKRILLIEKYEKPTEIYEDGTMIWRNKYGQLHRDRDKPAVTCVDSYEEWYKNGLLHRDNDKPAMILANGCKYWFKNGIQHREKNKPAVTLNGEGISWLRDGIEYFPKV